MTEKDIERFWAKVDRNGPDECWIWRGALGMRSWGGYYGEFRLNRNNQRATHVALAIDGRPRPSKDFHALHSCDNTQCVNPRHLRWGTHRENMQDAIKRGRARGTLLTPEQVREIRVATGTQKALARKYGCSESAIGRVQNRETYRDVA